MQLQGRIFIARHGETVFNKAAIMQGDRIPHTPLTRQGFAQAEAMGHALAKFLGTRQSLSLWAADTGRAQQTMAVITECIGANWGDVRFDKRLNEIDVGDWTGRSYASIIDEQGEIIDHDSRLMSVKPPNGEWYDDIAARLTSWMKDTADERGDRLVIMHGISSRVLRGLQRGLPVDPRWKAPVAESLSQGSLSMVGFEAEERIIHSGDGGWRA